MLSDYDEIYGDEDEYPGLNAPSDAGRFLPLGHHRQARRKGRVLMHFLVLGAFCRYVMRYIGISQVSLNAPSGAGCFLIRGHSRCASERGLS